MNAFISSFLWRVRGGLRIFGHKLPMNKIWFAVYIGIVNSKFHQWDIVDGIIGFIAAYTSYQLYGWGKYLGALLFGTLNKSEKECELIDSLLDPLHVTWKGKKYYLWDYPRLYGFIGTSLSMLIITFIIGIAFGSLSFMLCGLSAGLCYSLGYLISKYVINDGKCGWNWGEWIFGFVMGLAI